MIPLREPFPACTTPGRTRGWRETLRRRAGLAATLVLSCLLAGCAKKHDAKGPITEERAGSRAIDYVPRGADLAFHVNVARLRKSPLFLAAVGFVRGKGHADWLKYQEKECGFPLLYVFEDVVFSRGEDGDLIIARLGVGSDEMSQCWTKLHSAKAKIQWPSDLPDYELHVRDGLAFLGDARAVARAKKMAKPTVHDPRGLELAGDEAIRAEGSIELGPFRSISMTLETEKGGFTTQADLEAYSDTMAGAVHQKLAQVRDHTLERAKNPLARDFMKSVRLSSSDTKLTVRAGFHGTAEEQLRYVDMFVELALELAGRAALAPSTPKRGAGDAGAP